MTDDQIEMTCGACAFFRPGGVTEQGGDPAANDTEAPPVTAGQCYRFPPHGQAIQSQHPMTGQILFGNMAVRPPVNDNEPACGEFDYKDWRANEPVDVDEPA